MNRIKVLFLTNAFPDYDNKNRGVFNLRSAILLSQHVELFIINLRAWYPGRPIKYKYEIEGLTVNVFSFPLLFISKKKIFALQLFIYKRIFYRQWKKYLTDISVVHSVGAGFSGIVGSYIAKKKKIKHISQCIGTDINVTIPAIKSCIGIKNWEKNVNVFACNSNKLNEKIKFLYPENEAITIYRGVDLGKFIPNGTRQTDSICFTFLGGLAFRPEFGKGRDYKGGITLLKAWLIFWKGLSPELANKVKLNFGGPDVNKRLVEEIIGDEPINYNIDVIGVVPKDSVVDLYQKTNVVIIPSWLEGLPNVGMEAMACGCAIIGTNVGGIPELVFNNENGCLFEPGDSLGLSSCMEQIMDKKILEKFEKKSRVIAEQKFDNKQFLKGYLKLYV